MGEQLRAVNKSNPSKLQTFKIVKIKILPKLKIYQK